MTTKKKTCRCRPSTTFAECAYCGNGLSHLICGVCADKGIDGPVKKSTEFRYCTVHAKGQASRFRVLTYAERTLARRLADDAGLSLSERRLLSEYLRGPHTCNRFDALPLVLQEVARDHGRLTEDAKWKPPSGPSFYIKGKLVKHGQRIKDFRGDTAVFLRVSRAPEPGKSGKVLVDDGWGSHEHEFYPSVFNGEIR